MNLIRLLLSIIIAAAAGNFSPTSAQQTQTPVPAGEVTQIGCKAYCRKAGDEKSDGDRLDKRRDRGRRLYVGEGFRCVGKGSMKLLVHKREVVVNSSNGWRKIEEPTSGDQSDTAGRPNEENLNWLEGTYHLDAEASDDPSLTRQRIRQLIGDVPPHQYVPLYTFGSSPYLAMTSNQRTVNLAGYSGKADFASGREYSFALNDVGSQGFYMANGNSYKVLAVGNSQLLEVNWLLEDQLKTRVNIQPASNGQRLVVTREFYFAGQDRPVISRMVYTRKSKRVLFPFRGSQQLKLPENFAASDHENLTAELQETIDGSALFKSFKFSLVIKEPQRFAGTIIRGRVSRERDWIRKDSYLLVFQLENVLLADSAFYHGIVEQITTLQKTFHLVTTEGISITAKGGSASSRLAWSGATEPVPIIMTGSTFVVRIMVVQK